MTAGGSAFARPYVDALFEVAGGADAVEALLPSLEASYPWSLALLGTSLFSGFGIARRILGLEIALDHPRPAHLESAGGQSVARQDLVWIVEVNTAQLDTESRTALLLHQR